MADIVSTMVQVHPWRIDSGRLLHLVLRRSDIDDIHPSVWQVITGTIEAGEGSREAALRELREETGLTPIGDHTFTEPAIFYFVPRDQIIISPIFAFEIDRDSQPLLSDEHEEFQWLETPSAVALLEFRTHREGVLALDAWWRTERVNPFRGEG